MGSCADVKCRTLLIHSVTEIQEAKYYFAINLLEIDRPHSWWVAHLQDQKVPYPQPVKATKDVPEWALFNKASLANLLMLYFSSTILEQWRSSLEKSRVPLVNHKLLKDFIENWLSAVIEAQVLLECPVISSGVSQQNRISILSWLIKYDHKRHMQ